MIAARGPADSAVPVATSAALLLERASGLGASGALQQPFGAWAVVLAGQQLRLSSTGAQHAGNPEASTGASTAKARA